MKYTSGPWYPGHMGNSTTECECRGIVDETYLGGIAKVFVDNGIKSISEGGNDCPPYLEAVGNMHLIAAAPEMYELLLFVLSKQYLDTEDLTKIQKLIDKIERN